MSTDDKRGFKGLLEASADQTQQASIQNAVQALNKIAQVLADVFPVGGATSSSASAGAATLPANPLGFLAVTLPDGTAVKIPYYNP